MSDVPLLCSKVLSQGQGLLHITKIIKIIQKKLGPIFILRKKTIILFAVGWGMRGRVVSSFLSSLSDLTLEEEKAVWRGLRTLCQWCRQTQGTWASWVRLKAGAVAWHPPGGLHAGSRGRRLSGAS